MKSESGWRSVETGPPEFYKAVLVWSTRGYVRVADYMPSPNRFLTVPGMWSMDGVTHWMPLPEWPK